MNDTIYWSHNTAYHKWILAHAKNRNRVLDVGCGDGLLVQRLTKICDHVTGIDPHVQSVEKAKERLSGTANAAIIAVGFEDYEASLNSFDLIIFAASLHHMEQEYCIKKAKTLLAPNGKLLVVGCATPCSFSDWFVEIVRILPARVGSFLHGQKKDAYTGVCVKKPDVNLSDIRDLVNRELPGAKMKQGLYYRYLLSWIKLN